MPHRHYGSRPREAFVAPRPRMARAECATDAMNNRVLLTASLKSTNCVRSIRVWAQSSSFPTGERARLPPRPDAIDAPIRIAADVVTDGCSRDGAWPEHDAGPRDATCWIVHICAVYDGLGRFAAHRDACYSQQCADREAREGEGRGMGSNSPHELLLSTAMVFSRVCNPDGVDAGPLSREHLDVDQLAAVGCRLERGRQPHTPQWTCRCHPSGVGVCPWVDLARSVFPHRQVTP